MRCVKEAAEFAAAWSGGDDSPGLNEAETYAKSLKVRKEPGDGQLGILAIAQLKRAPKWPIACLKTLLQAPEQFCRRKGEAWMFTSAHVKQMETSLLPQITEACKIMDKAREWLGPDLLRRPYLAHKLMGDMDDRLVMHVHGFEKNAGTLYPSLEAIVQQFVKDVLDAGGDSEGCPWNLPTDASAAAASAASAQPLGEQSTILEFDADGSLDLGQLKSVFGMEVGTTVALKTDSKCNVSHIAKVDGRTITLVGADSSTIAVTGGELVDLCKVIKVEPDIVVRSADFLKVENNALARLECISSQSKQLLFEAFRLHQPHACVDMKFVKGKDRHVFAAGKYPTGGLKLVRYSTNLNDVAVEGNAKVPGGAFIQLKILRKEFGGSAFITTFAAASAFKINSKPVTKDLPVPFWLVRPTGDEDRANMHRSH